MARPHKPIKKVGVGKNIAIFCHPLRNRKTVRFDLGDDTEAKRNLAALNRIFLDESNWLSVPPETPDLIKTQWEGREAFVSFKKREPNEGSDREIAILKAQIEALVKAYAKLERLLNIRNLELEDLRGKKFSKESLNETLEEALKSWLTTYTTEKQDNEHRRTVTYDLERFVRQFGPKTKLADLEGQELHINAWIQKLERKVGQESRKLSPGRKHHVRIYVIKFLSERGLKINRAAITAIKKETIAESRGAIRALDKATAAAMAAELPSPWNDMFRIQTAIGLRPDECIQLHKNNFVNSELSILELAPLEPLTLKTGKRTIPIPEAIRRIFQGRMDKNPIIFPNPKTGKVWVNPKLFNRQYSLALQKAAKILKIGVRVDARTGRRTCASLLLQAGFSPSRISDLLGNSAQMIIDHYGDPGTLKMDLTASTLGDKINF